MTWEELLDGFVHLPDTVRLPYRAIQPCRAKRPDVELRTTVLGVPYVGTGHALFRASCPSPYLRSVNGEDKVASAVRASLKEEPIKPLGWRTYGPGYLLYLRTNVIINGDFAAPILAENGCDAVTWHSSPSQDQATVAQVNGEPVAIVMPMRSEVPWDA